MPPRGVKGTCGSDVLSVRIPVNTKNKTGAKFLTSVDPFVAAFDAPAMPVLEFSGNGRAVLVRTSNKTPIGIVGAGIKVYDTPSDAQLQLLRGNLPHPLMLHIAQGGDDAMTSYRIMGALIRFIRTGAPSSLPDAIHDTVAAELGRVITQLCARVSAGWVPHPEGCRACTCGLAVIVTPTPFCLAQLGSTYMANTHVSCLPGAPYDVPTLTVEAALRHTMERNSLLVVTHAHMADIRLLHLLQKAADAGVYVALWGSKTDAPQLRYGELRRDYFETIVCRVATHVVEEEHPYYIDATPHFNVLAHLPRQYGLHRLPPAVLTHGDPPPMDTMHVVRAAPGAGLQERVRTVKEQARMLTDRSIVVVELAKSPADAVTKNWRPLKVCWDAKNGGVAKQLPKTTSPLFVSRAFAFVNVVPMFIDGAVIVVAMSVFEGAGKLLHAVVSQTQERVWFVLGPKVSLKALIES
jgi:hypothetical protein